jgi:hypothetical protein
MQFDTAQHRIERDHTALTEVLDGGGREGLHHISARENLGTDARILLRAHALRRKL